MNSMRKDNSNGSNPSGVSRKSSEGEYGWTEPSHAGSGTEKKTNGKICNQIRGAVAAAMFQFAMGASFGYTGVLLPAMTDHHSTGLVLDPLQATLFSSLLHIGAMVGALVSVPLMVYFGQRLTLLITTPVAAAGWLMIAYAQSAQQLEAARILIGFTSGIYGGPSSTYVVEISHSSMRGRLTGLLDMFRQFGLLFVYMVGSSGLSWRQTALVCSAVTTIVPFLFIVFMPDSPRWLVTRDKLSEARKSLKYYRDASCDYDEELQAINQELHHTGVKASTKEQLMVLTEGPVVKMLLILIYIYSAYSFNGAFTIMSFTATVFESAHVNIDAYFSTIIIGVVRIFGVAFYILMTDKFGRQGLLITVTTLSSFGTVSMGLYFYLAHIDFDLSDIMWLPLASASVIVFFSCVIEPLIILLRGELLPTAVRPVGVPIVGFCHYIASFLVMFFFFEIIEKIGSHGLFWIYSAIGLSIAILVYIFIPETNCKSLEEIQRRSKGKHETFIEDT